MIHLSDHLFSIHLKHLDTGGWFISQLTWNNKTITQAESNHFAAGWELTVDNKRYTPHSPNIIPEPTSQQTDPTTCKITLPQKTTDGKIRILHHLQINSGVLEQSLELINLSTKNTVITNMNFAQLKLDPSFTKNMQVWHQYAQTLSPVTDNYFDLHDPAILLHQPNENWGLAILNMAPAQTHRISTGVYTSIGYNNGSAPFAYHLAAKESFTSDLAITAPYMGNAKQAGQAALYRYIKTTLRPQPLRQALTYCSWEPFGRDIDETRILKQIDQASERGFETFVIDDGWQKNAGDWDIDPTKFPNGLKPIANYLQKKAMHLGLWISLATINEKSNTHTDYEDCIIRNTDSSKRATHVYEGTLSIACLASRFTQHIENKLHALIKNLDLRYIKIDLPVAYDVYHKPVILCHANDHDHAPGHDYTLKVYRTLQTLSRRLKATFPKLVIDLTFELWGGWHAIDPALLECADVSWLSNISDANDGQYGPAQTRHLAASRAHLIPPEHLVVGNLRCNSPHPQESAASAFASYPMLLGDLSEGTPADHSAQHALFSWFKKERDRSDITQHFASLLEKGHASPSTNTYSGFLRTDKTGNGILGLFRNNANAPQATLPILLPENINDANTARLINAQTQNETNTTVADLRTGLNITLSATHDFQLFSVHVTHDETNETA